MDVIDSREGIHDSQGSAVVAPVWGEDGLQHHLRREAYE